MARSSNTPAAPSHAVSGGLDRRRDGAARFAGALIKRHRRDAGHRRARRLATARRLVRRSKSRSQRAAREEAQGHDRGLERAAGRAEA